MKLYAFHLLNDYSGSPKVLKQLAEGWQEKGLNPCVCSSFNNRGFLSDLPSEISRKTVWYRFYENRLLRLFGLLLSQWLLFLKFFFRFQKEDLIYVNTVLPFGAALAGWAKGCRVVYHIHETTVKPAILKHFLFGIVKLTADDVIYVSNYLAEQEKREGQKTHILHNAIPETFLQRAQKLSRDRTQPKNILMICSLKVYKGVFQFVELAEEIPSSQFRMVINAPQEEIDSFFKNRPLPENLTLFPTQRDVIPHYDWADLIMNLSLPEGWVETFGLTIIEGMAFGLPAIVPPAGGIMEVVDHGFNGFHADPHDLAGLKKTIRNLFSNPEEYQRLSLNSSAKLLEFKESAFIQKSLQILGNRP